VSTKKVYVISFWLNENVFLRKKYEKHLEGVHIHHWQLPVYWWRTIQW